MQKQLWKPQYITDKPILDSYRDKKSRRGLSFYHLGPSQLLNRSRRDRPTRRHFLNHVQTLVVLESVPLTPVKFLQLVIDIRNNLRSL